MNYFIEGLQGSGKTTASTKLAEKYKGLAPVREGEYSPVELAWCAYVDEAQYADILDRFPALREEIGKKTFAEGGRRIICYTKIRTDDTGFYSALEQYEIYNGRRSLEEFKDILLARYRNWRGDGSIFECSLLQNIVEDLILFRDMSDDDIVDFYRGVRAALEGREYRVIYLETEDVAANLAAIRKERTDGDGREVWFEMLCGFFNDSPHARAHGLSGFDGLVTHLKHRQRLELRILRELFPERTCVLRSKGFTDIVI